MVTHCLSDILRVEPARFRLSVEVIRPKHWVPGMSQRLLRLRLGVSISTSPLPPLSGAARVVRGGDQLSAVVVSVKTQRCTSDTGGDRDAMEALGGDACWHVLRHPEDEAELRHHWVP